MDYKSLTPWNWFKHDDKSSNHNLLADWSQNHPFSRIHNEIDKVFSDILKGSELWAMDRMGSKAKNMVVPRADISELEDKYLITVEIPGVKEKDVELSIQNGNLVIKGEKKEYKEEKEAQYHRIERAYGTFQRTLAIPGDAEENKIKADFNNGILSIEIPKNKSIAQAVKRIPINKK